jgi:hypothetical protein
MTNEALAIPRLLMAADPSNSPLDSGMEKVRLRPWGGSMKNWIRLALIASSMIVPGLVGRGAAQIALPSITFVQVSGPGSAYPTEHLSFCYTRLDYPYTPEDPGGSEEGAFVPRAKATVTLRIVDATTGAEKAKKVLAVTPGALPSDPCVEFVVPAVVSTASVIASVAPASTPVYIGVVSVSSQPLPPSAVSSSLQIFAVGQNGLPTNVRVIPPAVTCPANDFPCGN